MTDLRVMDLLARKERCTSEIWTSSGADYQCDKEEGHAGRHVCTGLAFDNADNSDVEITVIWGEYHDPTDGYEIPF